MWGKPDLGAFHKQITIPDFLGFLLSCTLRLQWKSGWSSCKKVNARILIHSNTDVWLSKYFSQTRSLGFIFVILPFWCWWQSHGSELPSWMPQSRTNQAINPKPCVVSLPAKLLERKRSMLRKRCSEWRLFGRQDTEKAQKFRSLSPKASQQEAMLREASKVLEHLHQKEKSRKSSRKPGRSSENAPSPTVVIFSWRRKLHIWFLTDFHPRF